LLWTSRDLVDPGGAEVVGKRLAFAVDIAYSAMF
jgi:hypothetical protein